MSAPLNAAIALLAKDKTFKSLKSFQAVVGGIKDAKDSGALDITKDMFAELTDASIPATAFQVFVSLVKAESTQEGVRLFNELMDLMGLDGTKNGATAISTMVQDITGAAADITSIGNSINDLLGDNGYLQRFARALLNIFVPFETAIALLERLADALERISQQEDPVEEAVDQNLPGFQDWWNRFVIGNG